MTDEGRARSSGGSGEFVEALARGLDVITCFGPTALELTVSEVASRTGLARPTARRLLLTLEQLGYVRSINGSFSLTTKVLKLGTAGIAAQGMWDVARPHLVALVGRTGAYHVAVRTADGRAIAEFLGTSRTVGGPYLKP